MLNRFLAMKSEQDRPKEKRPYLASLCENLVEAEKWRMQIMREVSKKVSLIQNAGWGEFRLREMNDEINKLLREKHHWEKRIRELGGPDYHMTKGKDVEGGEELAGSGGYKYFGAAKDLPGVRELFEKAEAQSAAKRTRKDLYEGIDPDYYGYRDEDDGLLPPLEQAHELVVRKSAIEAWHANAGKRKQNTRATEKNGMHTESDDVEVTCLAVHVPLPKHEDIEQAVLARKKRDLLAKYASEDLIKQETEAKQLLHIAQ